MGSPPSLTSLSPSSYQPDRAVITKQTPHVSVYLGYPGVGDDPNIGHQEQFVLLISPSPSPDPQSLYLLTHPAPADHLDIVSLPSTLLDHPLLSQTKLPIQQPDPLDDLPASLVSGQQ